MERLQRTRSVIKTTTGGKKATVYADSAYTILYRNRNNAILMNSFRSHKLLLPAIVSYLVLRLGYDVVELDYLPAIKEQESRADRIKYKAVTWIISMLQQKK